MQQRIHRQQEGSLIYYTSDNITTKHLFTTKFGGVSKGYLASLNLGFNRGDERSNVLQNYQILADHFRVPRARMTMTKQIHSDIVRVVDENTMGMGLGQPMRMPAKFAGTSGPTTPTRSSRTCRTCRCSPTGRTAASSRSTTRLRVRSVRCTPAGAVRRAVFSAKPYSACRSSTAQSRRI